MTIPIEAKKLYEKAKEHIESKELFRDMLVHQDKVENTVEILTQAIKIAPDFIEARRLLTFLNKKTINFYGNILPELYSKVLKDIKEEMPDEAKQRLDKLIKSAKELRLKNEKYDMYKFFREWQENVKKQVKKYPNDEFIQLMANTDLTNIDIIMDYTKNYISKNPNDKSALTVLDMLESFQKYALYFIPFLIQKKIKNTIIDLGIKHKYNRIHTAEIAEKCKEPEDVIICIIREMIENEEIFGEFFSSTKSLLFNQQANIDNVDNIMKNIKQWETNFCNECGMKINEAEQNIKN